MKKYFFFLLLFFTKNAFAQKGLAEMIAAEKSFASYSVMQGTREAFLRFADTSSIMFSNGEPVNGYQLWSAREKRPGVLHWRPRFAEISSSGDFGYTCGPWTFQANTTSDPVAANGYFFTVWQKNKNGEWKFVLDIGTEAGPLRMDTSVVVQTAPTRKGTEVSLWEAEADFIRMYKMDSVRAYELFLSRQSVTAREGKGLEQQARISPVAGRDAEGLITFSALGSSLSPAGDLGYIYGTATLHGKKESYLRIWRRELQGWKIALQMIRLP